MTETVLVQEPSGEQYWKEPQDVQSSDVILHGEQKSKAEAVELVQLSKPAGSVEIIEDYTQLDPEGRPLQKVTIWRPPPDPISPYRMEQRIGKTDEGKYIYTETYIPRDGITRPPTPVQVSQADIEKSKEIGKYIGDSQRTEPIHETAKEFDKPPEQIPKGIQLGISSVVYGIGATFVEAPKKVVAISQELGDRPGKMSIILERAKQKTEKESIETSRFAMEEPVAFAVSTGVQLAFFELGLRTIRPFARFTPRVTTSMEIGQQFQTPKGTYTKSGIITKVGKEKYVSKVDTFVFGRGTSKISTGISTIETSRKISAPSEFRIAVSQSINLGKFKPTFEITVPAKRVIRVGSKTAQYEMPIMRIEDLFVKEQAYGYTRTLKAPPGKKFTGKLFHKSLEMEKWKEAPIVIEKGLKTGEFEYVVYHEVLHRRFPGWSEKKILDVSATGRGEKQIFKNIKFTEIEQAKEPVTRFTGLKPSPEGLEYNIAVARIQEIKMDKGMVGKPTDIKMIGFSKRLPEKIETLSSGITDRGKPSVMASIIKTAPPEPSKVMKLVGGKTTTFPKPLAEIHLQAIAKGIETEIKTKAIPKFTTGGFKPIPKTEQMLELTGDIEFIHIAPIGKLEKPLLESKRMMMIDVNRVIKTDQRITTRPAQLTSPVIGLRKGTMFREDILTEQIQLHKTLQIQEQIQKTKLTTSTKITPINIPIEIIIVRTPPPTPPPPRGLIGIPFDQAKPKGIKKKLDFEMKREFDYTPSLTAFSMKIKGKGKKPKKEKFFTGFEIRPIFD